MKFFDPLVVQWTGSNSWILHNELRCEADNGEVFYIPAGLTTDLASIPRVLWSFLPPQGPWARASVLHDWLYEQRYYSDKMDSDAARRECDRLFWEAMRDDGVDKETRDMIYSAVRAFGKEVYET